MKRNNGLALKSHTNQMLQHKFGFFFFAKHLHAGNNPTPLVGKKQEGGGEERLPSVPRFNWKPSYRAFVPHHSSNGKQLICEGGCGLE